VNIREFIENYSNHPVLFVGAGMSLRYLNNSYTWDGLLKKISTDLSGNREFYLDIKSQCQVGGKYNYSKIATTLEAKFNKALEADRDGKFKDINDIFYEEMEKENNLSRFKIYISKILGDIDFREEMLLEISKLKTIRKNIGSVITTNYDKLIESLFDFEPLVGNDILLSNPYGSVYKIHGCNDAPSKIIITESDYINFDKKYELIRAQLLSIFIHNPIIFIGYGIGDENIKSLLKTIFTYVEPNSVNAKKIRDNFLLVEYCENSMSHDICEHDIDIEGFSTITINKIKTNDFLEIYSSLSDLKLPVSAMDVRKVQSVVNDIYSGGSISVSISQDLDSLRNNDRVLAIGSKHTLKYMYQDSKGLINNYFNIIDESNNQFLEIINSVKISSQQWFPIFGFHKILPEIKQYEILKKQQKIKLDNHLNCNQQSIKSEHKSIEFILDDELISSSNKINAIMWSTMNDKLDILTVKSYLLKEKVNLDTTSYRRLLCAYDYMMYRD